MPICNLQEMKSRMVFGTRIVGFDVGDKTIGVSISDPMLSIATAIGTVERKDWAADLAALAAIFKVRNVGGVVVGLPLNMDGSEGPRCAITRKFANKFLADWKVMGFAKEPPLCFQDERLSTSAVDRFLVKEADTTRKRRDAVVDKLAATYILQGALDRLG